MRAVLEFGKKARIRYILVCPTCSARDRSERTIMDERRHGGRYIVSLPIRVKWKDENGKEKVEEGLTENVGPEGTLVYLPRQLPTVGSKVHLTINENPSEPVSVTAQVIRLERNAAHPQVALQVTDGFRNWKKKVWEFAGKMIAAERPDEVDEW